MSTEDQNAPATTAPAETSTPAPTAAAELTVGTYTADVTGVDENAPIQLTDKGPEELTAEDIALLSPAVQEQLAAEAKAAQEAAEAEEAAQQQEAANEAAKAEEATTNQTPEVDIEAEKAKLQAHEEKRAELFELFDNGELSGEDYRNQDALLVQQQVEANLVLKQAEQQIAQAAQSEEAAWVATREAHLSQYPELKSETHLGGFHTILQVVDNETPGLDDQALLDEAHRRYAAFAHASGNPLSSAPATGDGPQLDKSPRPDPVPTLASAPPAGDNAPSDGTHAAIDKTMETDPFRAMDMLESMSDDAIESYLSNGQF